MVKMLVVSVAVVVMGAMQPGNGTFNEGVSSGKDPSVIQQPQRH